ncbi:MAG: transposase [Bacteroidetes bacterium]|nr:transposase [Bacteroidota bacterium]
MFYPKAKPAQQSLWIATEEIVSTPANSFYTRFDKALVAMGFPEQVRSLCRPFYDSHGRGRPGIDPLVYFKMLLGRVSVRIGFFENLSSERAIAARCADSLSIRSFLHYELTEGTPDHSSARRHPPTPRSGGLRAGLRPGAAGSEAARALARQEARHRRLEAGGQCLDAHARAATQRRILHRVRAGAGRRGGC